MGFLDTLSEMLVILFAIACGYAANRLGILGGEADRKISRLLMNIIMPAMILGSVCTGDALPEQSVVLGTLGAAAVFYLLEFAFAFLLPPLLGGTPGQKGIWRFAMVFNNMAYVGYPVVTALFGPEALFYAVILNLPFNVMAFTLGPLMLTGSKRFSLRQIFTPITMAALAALVLTLARLRPPAVVGEALAFVGSIMVPLSLMFVGSLLAELPLRAMLGTPRLWILTAVRLLVMPAVLAPILHIMGVSPIILGVAVAEMGMPASVNGSIICMEYGGDTDCMAKLIFVSTLASIVTIPIVAAVLL